VSLVLVIITMYVSFGMNMWMLLCLGCIYKDLVFTYTGTASTTVSGKQCQSWSVDTPHEVNYLDDSLYPDGSRAAAHNYCRNPDLGWDGGLWCYTTDPGMRWDYCIVPLCGVYMSMCIIFLKS